MVTRDKDRKMQVLSEILRQTDMNELGMIWGRRSSPSSEAQRFRNPRRWHAGPRTLTEEEAQ